MWSVVLVLALWTAGDPIRIGITVLLVSRPRPLLNLLAFWLGGMTTGVSVALGAVILLPDYVPVLVQDVRSTVASVTAGYLQIAIGVLALLIAARLAVKYQRPKVATPAGRSALMLRPNTPTVFARLSARAYRSLEGGYPWVAFMAGLGSATPPVEYLVAIATIVASRAAIGTQLSAAVMFTVVVLAVVEIPLVSYLGTPAKTEATMLRLHSWLRDHSRQLLVINLAVAGIMLAATAVGKI
jgi:hypothetical protein